MKQLLSVLFCFSFLLSSAQTIETIEDSIKGKLEDVIVKAFDQNRRLQDVPAAVSYIGRSELTRYSNTTILPAVNTTPGVRMEERSPGSYRLNIRGSSMRSPFGVRNVKVYYNNLPITDPGGQTFLNQLGFYNVQSIEIIKGPAGSLYGAGTGGVVLIESSSNRDLQVNYSVGSYGLQNIHASVGLGSEEFSNTVSYQHQSSDGYRTHTNMRRDMFSWGSKLRTRSGELTTTFLSGDLFYQTPGALTLKEYEQDAKAARPRAGANPGAVETKAAIYQKSFLAGASYKHSFSEGWQNTTSLYGAYTQLRNPAIRNYGRNDEPHFGGRSIFQFKKEVNNNSFLFHAGAELQQGFTTSRVYSNKSGNPDTLQTDDEINNRQSLIFTQFSWEHKQWILTAGISLNKLKVGFTRLSVVPVLLKRRVYSNEFAPRLAILRKVGSGLNIYGSIAKGFSPPTSAELLPSTGIINTMLNAEQGINYELGAKGNLLNENLSYDVNAFFFRLKNTIVQRRDATGGDFFLNAGSTKQSGLETALRYTFNPSGTNNQQSRLWLSHSWNNFRYDQFKQVNNDFSGKRLPGISPHTIAAGADVFAKNGLYLNLNYFYAGAAYLNDANTSQAEAYHLVGSRIGFKGIFSKKYTIDIFGGADNLLNVDYSLGNDINAFGDRFYNPAATRNFYAGVSLRSMNKK